MEKHHAEPTAFPPIKYKDPPSAFFRALQQRVAQYFENRTRYATPAMHAKTVVLLLVWMLSYALMLSNWLTGWTLTLVQVVFQFTMFVMSVGIAHDASHQAYSPHARVNDWLNRVFDLVGINTYMWEFNHVRSHHNAPNIPLYDSAIDSFRLFRFHPRAAYYDFHRYQHFYIFGIYALATLFKLFFLDFFSFTRGRIGFIIIREHPVKEVLYLIFTRLAVITYTLVIPLLVIDAPAGQILLGFLTGHVLSGVALGMIFQVTHLAESTTWPEPDTNGVIDNSFDLHILQTTADFAPSNPMVTWISGGLNIHVAHHFFPGVCQIHLPALARIVRDTAAEYQVGYRSFPTVWSALRSHLRTLKLLGEPQSLIFAPAAGQDAYEPALSSHQT